jgi:hypothetical protein
MARKASPGSKSAYFRKLFADRPEWLNSKSNDAIVTQWLEDHPGKEMGQKEKQSLANVKSILRRQGRKGKRGRPKGSTTTNAVKANPTRGRAENLEQLELMIDHCLATARRMESQRLEKAIRSLRAARNEVVWQMGQA